MENDPEELRFPGPGGNHGMFFTLNFKGTQRPGMGYFFPNQKGALTEIGCTMGPREIIALMHHLEAMLFAAHEIEVTKASAPEYDQPANVLEFKRSK